MESQHYSPKGGVYSVEMYISFAISRNPTKKQVHTVTTTDGYPFTDATLVLGLLYPFAYTPYTTPS